MTHDQELLAAAKENLALRVSVHSAEEIVSNIRLRKAIENHEQAAKREPVVEAVYQYMAYRGGVWDTVQKEAYEHITGAYAKRILFTRPPEAMAKDAERLAKYNELLLAVSRKFPDESRHETALRYIRRAEIAASEPSTAATTPRGG